MIFKTLVIIFLIGIGCDTTNIYNELKEIRKIKEQTNERNRKDVYG